MDSRSLFSSFLLILCFCAGCASVGVLEGGDKDTTPPKLLSVTPQDSLLNTRVTKIELRFDEFIALNDPAKEIQISPLLSVPPTVTGLNKKVTVRIPDSLLQENTTYRITFGSSVKDIHEDNKITGITYTFSTGSYFDSLSIGGRVLDARTGLPDSGVFIILYPATVDDSAVIKSRPQYIGRTDAGGSFSIKGLPGKNFKVYALKDGNDNLIFDGGKEKIGFIENIVMPGGDSATQHISFRTFEEVADTSGFADTAAASSGKERRGMSSDKNKAKETEEFSYSVGVDTSNKNTRSKDITKPIEITFNREITNLNVAKISLSTDTANTGNEAFTAQIDSVRKNTIIVSATWKEDALYTLRLLKGFATDSAGMEALPSKYIFHTKRDDDYSKMKVNIPSKYYGEKYLLLIQAGNDTIHYKPVTDSVVNITKLNPGAYSMRIIVDENRNGLWDTGDLMLKRQPEMVVPYPLPISLKAGWDNVLDFEVEDKKGKRGGSPLKSDRDTPK